IINAGPTPSSRKLCCSLFTRPGRQRDTPDEEQLPTGEPYAGKPPVRFGGRGGRQPFPTPIKLRNRDVLPVRGLRDACHMRLPCLSGGGVAVAMPVASRASRLASKLRMIQRYWQKLLADPDGAPALVRRLLVEQAAGRRQP